MRPRNIWRTFVLTVFVDAVMIVLSFIAAYQLRLIFTWPSIEGAFSFSGHPQVIVGIPVIQFWLLREAGLYRTTRQIRRYKEIFLVIKALTYALMFFLALTIIYKSFFGMRFYLLFDWVFTCLLVSIGRYTFIQWKYWRCEQQKDLNRILIIGHNAMTQSIIEWSKTNPHYGQKPVGILSCNAKDPGKSVEDVPILGITEQWEIFIQRLKPDLVILVDDTCSIRMITDIAAVCRQAAIDFKINAGIDNLIASNVEVEYVSNILFLGFRALPLDGFFNQFLKRTFDFLVAGIIALLFLPMACIVALLIKLDDGGDVFYFQERVGRDGKVFRLIKFRTMTINAEKSTGPVWTKPDDDRRTRYGKFLRRWNIDEFPQLLNVILGEMSLVGPRPERPYFVKKFSDSMPHYMARHKVKSGITGWAQVHGLRGDTSIDERIKYDFYYLENWTLLLDVEILVMTVLAFKNAY